MTFRRNAATGRVALYLLVTGKKYICNIIVGLYLLFGLTVRTCGACMFIGGRWREHFGELLNNASHVEADTLDNVPAIMVRAELYIVIHTLSR